MTSKIPPEFLKKLKDIKAKRPKTVIEHILKRGMITTKELKDIYGYDHPPRAARDVREQGIPLQTIKVKDANGKSIAAYVFGDLSKITKGKLGGRKVFPKSLKKSLLTQSHDKCFICQENYEDRYLQIDHRIPYEIAGEGSKAVKESDEYMLLCGSCNRSKSQSCEHCTNWTKQNPTICSDCYWASPENYKHLAGKQQRRVDITWTGDEVSVFDKIKKRAKEKSLRISEYIKSLLNSRMDEKK